MLPFQGIRLCLMHVEWREPYVFFYLFFFPVKGISSDIKLKIARNVGYFHRGSPADEKFEDCQSAVAVYVKCTGCLGTNQGDIIVT